MGTQLSGCMSSHLWRKNLYNWSDIQNNILNFPWTQKTNLHFPIRMRSDKVEGEGGESGLSCAVDKPEDIVHC